MAHTETDSPMTTRHAVILAAGESKRTRPLTLHRPKPLIPLLGQPLLAHILDQLVGLVERVTLVVGYRANDIRDYFGESYRDMHINYVHQHEVNGTAGALLVVADATTEDGAPLLDEPFFLLYGDNLISYTDLVRVYQQRYCMAALPVDDPSNFGILDVADGKVQRIIEKPPDAPPGSLSNPGIFHLDAQAFPALRQIAPSPRGEYELTDLIELLAEQHAVGYSLCNGHWIPVGTPWEVLAAGLFLLQQRAALRSSVHPKATIAPDCIIEGHVHIERAFIGAGTRIVGPAWIGDGVFVGADCTIHRAALEQGASIDDASMITHSLIGQHARVGSDCIVRYSVLDSDASLAPQTVIPVSTFDDTPSAAHTLGLLNDVDMRTRGIVLGHGVALDEGSELEAGSVIFPHA